MAEPVKSRNQELIEDFRVIADAFLKRGNSFESLCQKIGLSPPSVKNLIVGDVEELKEKIRASTRAKIQDYCKKFNELRLSGLFEGVPGNKEAAVSMASQIREERKKLFPDEIPKVNISTGPSLKDGETIKSPEEHVKELKKKLQSDNPREDIDPSDDMFDLLRKMSLKFPGRLEINITIRP